MALEEECSPMYKKKELVNSALLYRMGKTRQIGKAKILLNLLRVATIRWNQLVPQMKRTEGRVNSKRFKRYLNWYFS